MHDTYLLEKISKSLKVICDEKLIHKINKLSLIVHHKSHVNELNLKEHLEHYNKELIASDFSIEIQRDEIDEQTAIIQQIVGVTDESEKKIPR